MRSGRYSGATDSRRLALRIDAGTPDSFERVSGDLVGVPPGGGEAFLLSFDFDAGELPAVAGVPALASTDYSSLDFELQPATDERARVDLRLTRRDGAIEELAFTVERQGGAFRELRVLPYLVPGAQAPDSPGLPPVTPESSAVSPPPTVAVSDSLARAGVALRLETAEELPLAAAGADLFWSRAELATAAAALAPAGDTGAAGGWETPLLIASRYEEAPDVLGIMFQPDAGNRIARLAAVFYDEIRRHGKVDDDPVKFAREYLFTTVHELGHVLGLPHAWDALGEPPAPDRDASALTFMNYPDLYRLGYSRFYKSFEYVFRPEEQRFLRHAPWPEVWPGCRDPGEPASLARRLHPSLSLELRSPRGGLSTLGEPVQLEVKLANRSSRRVRVPIDVLELEGGRLRAFIAPADEPGAGARFRPLARLEFRSGFRYLGPADRDRGVPASLYQVCDLTYGSDGFSFAVPGRYRVSVAVEISPDVRVRSAPLELEIRAPAAGLEALVEELLRPAVGRALVLGCDPESAVRRRLEKIAGEAELPAAAAVAALRVGEALGRAFKHVERKALIPGDPEAALRWLGRAVEYSSRAPLLANPVRSRVRRLRAEFLAAAGRLDHGRQEIASLLRFLDGTIQTNGRLRRRVRRQIRRAWRRFLNQGGGR